MKLTLTELTRDISKIDSDEILSCWYWKVVEVKEVVFISSMGDLFFVGQDDGVYWLQTDGGDIIRVADNLQRFVLHLNDETKVDEWFLPSLIDKLMKAGKILRDDEVYSFIKYPVIGGDYAVDNIIPLKIAAHFSFTGQFCEQINNLPNGTKVTVKFKE